MGDQQQNPAGMDLSVRPLRVDELDVADRIFRLAFGTRLGLPDPIRFGGDAAMVKTRYLADHIASLGAEVNGELVGSNFATHWGSVGILGPLSIRPELWDRGIAKHLLGPAVELFAQWGTKHAGLFSPSDSLKHIGLYQKFGFWPRFLTAIMAKPVMPIESGHQRWRYSEVLEAEREGCVGACREVTDAIYEGLDLGGEIRNVDTQGLGDTVLLWAGTKLLGFAVCHTGPGSEAGSGACYVKFGAARPGPAAGEAFDQLLDACEALAGAKGMQLLMAGVNTSRHEAYGKMLARGFRTIIQGVAMHRPNEPSYNRPGVYVIDDWR